MYECWYDYVNAEHDEYAKMSYMDTDGFIV